MRGGVFVWFWVFMAANSIVIPILMAGFGKLFQKRPPAQINSIYGYRTKMSRLNMDTWNYAHRYFGKLWMRTGCLMIPGTVLCMALLYGRDADEVGTGCAVLMTVQVVLLILPVIATERELHRIFDLNGKRRQQTDLPLF